VCTGSSLPVVGAVSLRHAQVVGRNGGDSLALGRPSTVLVLLHRAEDSRPP
jgi:hypothetical protein